MSDERRYVQQLPVLGLSIERSTDRTPDDSRYFLYRWGEVIGSFSRLSDAQARFREVRDELGWEPPGISALDPTEQLRRDAEAAERFRQAEHWHRVSSRRGWFKGHRV